jgi:hypothetical protein
LSRGIQTIELVRLDEAPPVDEAVRVTDRTQAAFLLRAFSRDPMNMTLLRRTLGEEIGPQRVGRLGDAEVVNQLAAHISHDRLRIATLSSSRAVVEPRRIHDWTTRTEKVEKEEEVVKERPTGPLPAEESTTASWIKLEVVDDVTGEPVPGVTFNLKLPDGSTKDVVTDAAGVAELTGLDPGTFDIEKMMDGEGWEVVQVA